MNRLSGDQNATESACSARSFGDCLSSAEVVQSDHSASRSDSPLRQPSSSTRHREKATRLPSGENFGASPSNATTRRPEPLESATTTSPVDENQYVPPSSAGRMKAIRSLPGDH